MDEAERCQLRQIDQAQRGRTLEGEHRHLGRAVIHHRVIGQPGGQPLTVVVHTRRVHDQQQMIVAKSVNDEIVHRAAVLV